MGRANVYLPDELERRVRAAKIPVSEVCQAALLAAVEGAESEPQPQPLGGVVDSLFRQGWDAGTAWAAAAPTTALLALLRDQRLSEIPHEELPESWYSLNEEQTLAWEAGFAEAARSVIRTAIAADLPVSKLPGRATPADQEEPLSMVDLDKGGADEDVPLGDSSRSYIGVDRNGRQVSFDPHAALEADKSPLFAVLGPADQRARLTLSIGQDAASRGAAVVVVDVSGSLTSRANGLGKNVRIMRPSAQPLPNLDDLMRGGTNLRGLWETFAGLSAGAGLFSGGGMGDDIVKPGYVTVVSLSGDGAIPGALSAANAIRTLTSLTSLSDHPRLLLVDLPTGMSVPGAIGSLLTRLTRTAREHQVAFGLSAESADTVTGIGGSGALLSTVFGFSTSSPVEADRLRDLLGAGAPILLNPPGSAPRPSDESWCVMRDLEGRLGQVRIDTI